MRIASGTKALMMRMSSNRSKLDEIELAQTETLDNESSQSSIIFMLFGKFQSPV